MDVKKLTPNQQKAAWIGGAVLLSIHFAPSVIGRVRQQLSHTTYTQAAVPRLPAAINEVPVAAPSPALDPIAAQYLGVFSGQETLADESLTTCQVRLEVKPAVNKVGFYSAYETKSCMPSPLFAHRAMTPELAKKLPNWVAEASPVQTAMSGSMVDGELTFHIDQVFGATSLHCGPTAYSISQFGTGQIMASWKADPCPSGHLVLQKARV